jgi:RNA methyltransferase, TrmH family
MPPVVYILESPANPIVKAVRQLYSAKERQASGLVWVEGEHALTEVVKAGLECHQFFVRQDKLESLEAFFTQWVEEAEGVYGCSERVMKALSTTETPVAVAASIKVTAAGLTTLTPTLPAFVSKLAQQKPEKESSLLLVLDGVQDPGNVGTLVRSALAFGAWGVLCFAGTADVYSSKVIRASTGLVFRLPVYAVQAETVEGLKALEQAGFTVVLAEAPKEGMEPAGAYKGLPTQKPLALVLGQEGQGLRLSSSQKQGFECVGVPMAAGVESLNVAVSGSILLAQWYGTVVQS